MRKPTFVDPLIRKGAGACELIDARRGSLLAGRVEAAFDSKTRRQGLLGRKAIPGDFVLIIAPSNAVHTWFMRTTLDLVFVTRSGTVTKTRCGVRPWRVAGSLRAFAVIEAAHGFIDRHGIMPGDVVALREAAPNSTEPGT